MIARSLARILITCSILIASDTLLAKEQIDARKIGKAQSVSNPKIRRNFIDKFYSFFVRALSHSSIHKKLNDTYLEQNIDARRRYSFVFAGEDMGNSTNESVVRSGFNSQMNNALMHETFQSIDVLRNLSSILTCEFDIVAIIYSKPSAHAAPTASKVGRASKTQGMVNVANAQDQEIQDKAKDDKYSWANAGRFKGSLAPAVPDASNVGSQPTSVKPKMELNLTHYSETYSLRLPMVSGTDSQALIHVIRVPMGSAGTHIAREMDYKGDPIKSSMLNVYPKFSKTTLNLHYQHLTEVYAADLTYKFKAHQFTFTSSLPKAGIAGEALYQESAKYDFGYTVTL